MVKLIPENKPPTMWIGAIIAPDNLHYRARLFSVDAELEIQVRSAGNPDSEARLIDLVLNGVTSVHSRRSYRTGLKAFFTWIRASVAGPAFTKGLVQQY